MALKSISYSWLPLCHLAFFLRLPPFLSFGVYFFVFPLFVRLFLLASASQIDLFWLPGFLVWTPMVEYLWDSVVQSPRSPEFAVLVLSFMFALWMYLGFDCCCAFLWWSLPSSWLTECHSTDHILYAVLHVWTGCVEAGSSVCTKFWGFSLVLVQLFVLNNFFTI